MSGFHTAVKARICFTVLPNSFRDLGRTVASLAGSGGALPTNVCVLVHLELKMTHFTAEVVGDYKFIRTVKTSVKIAYLTGGAEKAGLENARLENGGLKSRAGKCRTGK